MALQAGLERRQGCTGFRQHRSQLPALITSFSYAPPNSGLRLSYRVRPPVFPPIGAPGVLRRPHPAAVLRPILMFPPDRLQMVERNGPGQHLAADVDVPLPAGLCPMA